MNLSCFLKHIGKVEANNRVNIQLFLNDDYSLLVEGSFSIHSSSGELVNSSQYVNSNFRQDILEAVQALLENNNVRQALFFEDTGTISLELENGLKFESYFCDGDYQTWELCKKGKAIYGSECGSIVRY